MISFVEVMSGTIAVSQTSSAQEQRTIGAYQPDFPVNQATGLIQTEPEECGRHLRPLRNPQSSQRSDHQRGKLMSNSQDLSFLDLILVDRLGSLLRIIILSPILTRQMFNTWDVWASGARLLTQRSVIPPSARRTDEALSRYDVNPHPAKGTQEISRINACTCFLAYKVVHDHCKNCSHLFLDTNNI